ncbi:MAG: Clp protease N-terminal domain-containing protein [Candidatus Sericytochromatia bacterium]|nr:Clp protease N-terminal domain-containing protein [Candidatus Sericytochromatia bacterium]
MTALEERSKLLEKFSASAIQALNAAREEALRLEFNQVETDHLLLGLVHEQRGLANITLQRHGVTSRQLRMAAERLSGRGYSLARQEDLVFSPDTIRVLGRLIDPRAKLVESADIFLALLEEPNTAAQFLLRDLSLNLGAIVRDVRAKLGSFSEEVEVTEEGETPVLPRHFVPRLLTAEGGQVFEMAEAATRAWGHNLVGTEQLLVGLIDARGGLASQILAAHGARAVVVEAVAARAVGRGSGTLSGDLKPSRWCEEACDLAWGLARKQGLVHVGTGHLLMGLLDLDVAGAMYILDQLDLNLPQIRNDLEDSFLAAPRNPEPQMGRSGEGLNLDNEFPSEDLEIL